ncbi:GerAB/ArcD/ProY family transporter [Desmospora activa]|nr:GerAB/ArcD/ProY family transporter [Desmospora activa]
MRAKSDQSANEKVITPYQSFCLLVNTLIGVGILSFQRSIIQEVGPDAIWILLIGGLVTLAEVVILTKVMQRFSGNHIVGAVAQLGGKKKSQRSKTIMAIPFVLILAVIWFSALSFVSRMFGEVLITVVLPRTPLVVLMVVLLGVAAAVASNRLNVLVRFSEFLMPFLFLPLPWLFAVWVQEGDWNHFLPLFQVDWAHVFKGVAGSFLTFSGASVLFMFMGYYQQPQKAMQSHTIGVGFVTLIYWVTLLSTLAVFGAYEMNNLVWPSLDLITVLTVPGLILERLESAFLSIWMVTVFTTLLNLYGALVDGLMNGFQIKERYRPYVSWGLLPLLLLTAHAPTNVFQVFRWGEWSGWLEPITIVIVLLCLFLLSLLRGRQNQGRQADAST